MNVSYLYYLLEIYFVSMLCVVSKFFYWEFNSEKLMSVNNYADYNEHFIFFNLMNKQLKYKDGFDSAK